METCAQHTLTFTPFSDKKIWQGITNFFPSPPKNPYDSEHPLSSLILSVTIKTKHSTKQYTNILWTASYGKELSCQIRHLSEINAFFPCLRKSGYLTVFVYFSSLCHTLP